jgi:hypothetical protein
MVRDVVYYTVGDSRIVSYTYRAIQIPVYQTTYVAVQIALNTITPPPKEGMSDGLIIGLVTGIAVVIALVCAAFRFVLRGKDVSESSTSGNGADGTDTDLETVLPNTVEDVLEEVVEEESEEEIAARTGGRRAPMPSISMAAGELDLEGLEGEGGNGHDAGIWI